MSQIGWWTVVGDSGPPYYDPVYDYALSSGTNFGNGSEKTDYGVIGPYTTVVFTRTPDITYSSNSSGSIVITAVIDGVLATNSLLSSWATQGGDGPIYYTDNAWGYTLLGPSAFWTQKVGAEET